MTKHTAIYVRQSVDKKDSLSIEGQIDLCKHEAQTDNIKIYQDKGFSGKNINRPAFSELMRDVEADKISRVVCYRLDRISRSIADFSNIWQMLSEHQVEFVSVNERFDTSTPMGRAMLYIIMVFAQLERETIAERVKDNYYTRVKKGAWGGGPAPYGFTNRNLRGELATLVPNADLETVKTIFNLYDSGNTSLRKVTQALHDLGIPGVKRDRWDSVSVGRILRQPAYVKADALVYSYYKRKGVILANDLEEFDGSHGACLVGKRDASTRKYQDMSNHLLALSSHQGVIDGKTFVRVQQKLDANRQIKNAGSGKYTWLSGLLKCGECGYALKVQNDTKSGRRFLVCSGKVNLQSCTHRHSEHLEDVEAYVSEKIEERLHDTQYIEQRQTKQKVDSQAEVVKIDEQISNLIQAIAEATPTTMKYVNAQIEKLEQQRAKLLSELSAPAPVDLRALYGLQFSTLDFDEKKELAHLLIGKVYCTTGSTRIEWL